MANSLNVNPIVYTSATSSSYKAAVALSQGNFVTLRIKEIYWYNPGTIGDVALVTDPQSGREIARLRCEVAGQSQIIPLHVLVSDFAVDELDSGVLKIYLE